MDLKDLKFYISGFIIAGVLISSIPAKAFFYDEEVSSINLMTAGSIETGLVLGSWQDAGVAADLDIGDVARHDLRVDNDLVVGNGDFRYRLFVDGVSGQELCEKTSLTFYRNGSLINSVRLSGYGVTIDIDNPFDDWSFEYSPATGEVASAGVCTFEYVVRAYEQGLDYGNGFFDEARVVSQIGTNGFGESGTGTSTGSGAGGGSGSGGSGSGSGSGSGGGGIGSGTSTDPGTGTSTDPGVVGYNPVASIVLNEIAADAIIGDLLPLQGKEWIEIYNVGTRTIDVANWKVSEVRGSELAFYNIVDESDVGHNDEVYSLTSGTDIAPGEFMVLVFQASNRLNNNDGDTVTLYLPDGTTVVSSHTYAEATDNTSEGRLPDGHGTWQATARTPGYENELPPEEDQEDI